MYFELNGVLCGDAEPALDPLPDVGDSGRGGPLLPGGFLHLRSGLLSAVPLEFLPSFGVWLLFSLSSFS